jgi:hypothetical protein
MIRGKFFGYSETYNQGVTMKDKLKARYDEFKNDRFAQGMLVGGAIGIGSMVVAGRFFGVNFDHQGSLHSQSHHQPHA